MCQGHHAAGRERVDPGAAGRAPSPLPPTPSARGRLVDLTHPFGVGIAVADFAAPGRVEASDFAARGFRNQRWTFVEHSGTHVDAPAHLFPDLADAASLPPGDLIAPVAALRLPPAGDDEEPTLGVEALWRHEREHGRIPPRAAVFLHTGWDGRYDDPTRFANVGPDGRRRAPGFAEEAVAWLIDERDVVCVGIDTLSIDVGSSAELPAHRRLLGSGRYAVECLRGLSTLPPAGATAVIGLVPWENGSGGPCRALAWW